MATSKAVKWGIVTLVVVLLLVAGGIIGLRIAVGIIKGKVVEALGPESEITALKVGWLAVEVTGLRLKGGQGWPAADTLRVERVVIAPATGALDSFMGVPRSTVVNSLKNKETKIAMNFLIEGDINNPQFTLREAFATRMASGMAEMLGVSIRGVAEGVGTLGRKGVETAGEAAKGLGDALQGLFGDQKKK